MIRPMPFAVMEAISHRLIQDEFAEPFIITRMITRPNFPPVPDPAFRAQQVPVTFYWDDKMVRLGMRNAEIASRKPMASMNLCDLQWEPKRGDTLYRCSEWTTFEITRIDRDSLSGLSAELVQLGIQN